MAGKSKYYHKSILCIVAIFLLSCEKLDESGFLDIPYHTVADVKQYCQGACEESYDWENSEIGVQGYIPGITDSQTMQDYKAEGHFFLSDIRNGMLLEIKIQSGLNDIFDTLSSLRKTDEIFIKGFARPITASDGTKCQKGVFIDINGLENIMIHTQ
jgi:hypothetical protein